MSAAWGQFTLQQVLRVHNIVILTCIRNGEKPAHFHQKYWPGPCDYNDDIKDDDNSDDNDGHMVETALCNLGRNVGSCLDWNSQNTKIPGHLKFRSWTLFYFQTLLSYHFQKHWRNFKVVFIEINKVKIHLFHGGSVVGRMRGYFHCVPTFDRWKLICGGRGRRLQQNPYQALTQRQFCPFKNIDGHFAYQKQLTFSRISFHILILINGSLTTVMMRQGILFSNLKGKYVLGWRKNSAHFAERAAELKITVRIWKEKIYRLPPSLFFPNHFFSVFLRKNFIGRWLMSNLAQCLTIKLNLKNQKQKHPLLFFTP